MRELEAWLHGQNGGIRTYLDFQRRCSELGQQDPALAAFYLLLGTAAGRFVAFYDGEPLPVDVAQTSLARLRDLVARSINGWFGSAEQQLAILNDIATTDLTAEVTAA